MQQGRVALGCGICGSKAELNCPSCINNVLVFAKRKELQELTEKRQALVQKLGTALALRQEDVERDMKRQQLEIAARQAREHTSRTEQVVQEAQRQLQALRVSTEQRRARVNRLTAELAARRAEHLSRHPTLLRYQYLTHSHVSAMLLAEQRAKLAVLLETLSLRISAIRSGSAAVGGGAPLQVTMCNLKLPEGAAVSSLMLQQPESTSTALGYMLLFLELVSTYLGGPLLHEGSFQGSTSVIWQQHSFWNRRPSSSNSRLPLFMEEGGPVGGSALSNAFPSLGLTSKGRGTSGWGTAAAAAQQGASGAVAALTRAISSNSGGSGSSHGGGGGGGGSGGAADRAVDEALARQRHTDLKLAYDLLVRSLSCFVRDKIQPLGLQLPGNWGPFGWLVVLCATVHRDPSTESVLTTAASMVSGAAAGAGAAWDGRGPGGGAGGAGLPDGADGGGGNEAYDEDPAEVEEDGWDVVQAPFLPPPPSQPDEVEHWSRAMFTDAQTHRRGSSRPPHGGHASQAGGATPGSAAVGQQAPGQGGPAAVLRTGSLGLERVRSIFNK